MLTLPFAPDAEGTEAQRLDAAEDWLRGQVGGRYLRRRRHLADAP